MSPTFYSYRKATSGFQTDSLDIHACDTESTNNQNTEDYRLARSVCVRRRIWGELLSNNRRNLRCVVWPFRRQRFILMFEHRMGFSAPLVPNGCDEPKALLWNRLYVVFPFQSLAQNLSQT